MFGLRAMITAIVIAAGLIVPALAADFEPRGIWQTTTGESRYRFDYCGNGSRLCATLIWLGAGAMTSPAPAQLGHYAVTEAKRVAANVWRGPLNFDGKTANTTLTFKSAKALTIAGCYFIWCKSFDLVKIGLLRGH
jgi:uncharacterized protein (DUF2147 family)